jgi:hypothetical protein
VEKHHKILADGMSGRASAKNTFGHYGNFSRTLAVIRSYEFERVLRRRLVSFLRRAGMSAFALHPLRLDTPPVLETSQDSGLNGRASQQVISLSAALQSECPARSLDPPFGT